MAPFSLERIDHVVLRVRDLAASSRFYQAVLGCRVERERPDLGLVHLRAGASLIDLVAVDGPLGRGGGRAPERDGCNLDHLCLRVGPFDEAAIVAHLAAFGLSPHGPSRINFGAEGMGPSLYFTDPDGHVIELKGPAAPVPDGAGGRRS